MKSREAPLPLSQGLPLAKPQQKAGSTILLTDKLRTGTQALPMITFPWATTSFL